MTDTTPVILALPTGAKSARVHAAALNATRELLKEGGLPAAAIDSIAARSGVSKATIYKHWPTRTGIASEAFGQWMAEQVPTIDTGDTLADIIEQVRRVSRFYGSAPGKVFAQLLAACVNDSAGAGYFRHFFLDARRAALNGLWERALAAGTVNPTVDAETATDLMFGPLIFRLMSGHKPLSLEEADKISSAALAGILRRNNQT